MKRHANQTIAAYYRTLAAAGLLRGTVRNCLALRAQRDAEKPAPACSLSLRLRAAKARLPLGEQLRKIYGDLARDACPRRKNWETAESSKTKFPNGFIVEPKNCGRYSSRCTYTRYEYTPRVSSYAFPVLPTRAKLRKGTETKWVQAPRGYRFEHDANGLKIVSISHPVHDWHPTMSEIWFLGVRHCVDSLKTAAKQRAQQAKEARLKQGSIKQASREGCRVCLQDSVQAGNCEAGTLSWGAKRGLKEDQHYKIEEIVALPTSNAVEANRVKLVIAAAIRRHAQEMRQGYCELSRHGVRLPELATA